MKITFEQTHLFERILVCMLLPQADEWIWLEPGLGDSLNQTNGPQPTRQTAKAAVSRGLLVCMLLPQADKWLWLETQFRRLPASKPQSFAYLTDVNRVFAF